MRITLRQLQIFRAVALDGTTTAAANRVALSQSATSASLNELERTLAVRLFDRVGRRLILNDSGRALLPNALAVLDGAHSLEAAFRAGDQPDQCDLHLFASTTIGNYVLPRLLARFTQRLSRPQLQVSIGNTLDVVTAVRDFAADLGLVEGPCHAAELTVIPWLTDALVIVAAPDHPLAKAAKRRKVTAQQLARAPWLLREPGSGTREAVEYALLPHVQHFENTMILGSSEAIKNSAAEGLGISCLSRCVVQDLVVAGRLALLATALPPLTRRFALIHHRKKVLSNPLRRFIEHCVRHGDPPVVEP
jgi:DNA-binding transcriptional LysR family regulator